MKAVVFHEYGGPENLSYEDIATPEPGPGEVVVRLHTIGLNHFDLDILAGVSGIDVPLPHVLGLEGAGEVAALGPGVDEYTEGEHVAPVFSLSAGSCKAPVCLCQQGMDNLCVAGGILGVTAPGTYAEYVKVAAHNLVRLPQALSFEAAAAVQVTMGTAWQMLIEQIRIRPGETVLINAVGGGIGSSAIQIAKLAGAWVIATAGNDQKLERARAMGADACINYRTQDLAVEARKLTQGYGVDAVVESVGGELLLASMQALAMGGRVATCGAHAGETVPIDIIDLFRRQLTLHGTHGAGKAQIAEVYRLVAAGELTPQIHTSLPLADAAEAHRVAKSRDFFGNILLKTDL